MKILIFFFLLLSILAEFDRNFIIRPSIKNYYITNFPHRIVFGINNTLNKLLTKKYIFDINVIEFNNFLYINRKNLINSFYSYKRNNIPLEIKASNTSAMLENDDRYKYILFKNYKKEINYKNLKYFPIIKILLKKYNSIKTCFFSIMDHKKIIPYHRGPNSGYLRYHFPIIVNPYSCYLEIMGTKKYNHNPILFDDTYPHKLVKIDNTLRVVLICDVENPYSLFHPHNLFF